jgi:ATP-dependent Clp protease ATP-binding subunit ClpA
VYFDDFSDKAKRAVFFAHEFARREGYQAIELEHLLRGLLREEPTLLFLVRPTDSAVVEKIKSDRRHPQMPPSKFAGDALPLAKGSREIVRRASLERRRFRQDATDTSHLLIAMLRSGRKGDRWFSGKAAGGMVAVVSEPELSARVVVEEMQAAKRR